MKTEQEIKQRINVLSKVIDKYKNLKSEIESASNSQFGSANTSNEDDAILESEAQIRILKWVLAKK